LNGKEEEVEQGGRLWVCIDALRKWRKEMEEGDDKLDKVSPRAVLSLHTGTCLTIIY